MFKKKYPLIIFGIIGVYHIGMNFIGFDSNRESKIAEAEVERLKRIKEI